MPCIGPNIDESNQTADVAFEEIWELLQNKYHVQDVEKPLRDGKIWKGFFFENCKKAKKDLRNALREVFWIDACDGF